MHIAYRKTSQIMLTKSEMFLTKKIRLASRHGGTCIITSEWHHVRVASHHVRVASRQSDITSEWHHVRATTCRPTQIKLSIRNFIKNL